MPHNVEGTGCSFYVKLTSRSMVKIRLLPFDVTTFADAYLTDVDLFCDPMLNNVNGYFHLTGSPSEPMNVQLQTLQMQNKIRIIDTCYG